MKRMRLLIAGIAACILSSNLVGSQQVLSRTAAATFAEHTIATNLNGGYQVVVSDINHDGKPDLIAVASGMTELVWFENPGWRRHLIVGNISRPINCAAWDIDGDRIPEIALAHEFSNDPARSVGTVSLLKHKGDPTQPWEITEIDRLTTSHRLRWAAIEGKGKKVLINAPLAGAQSRTPDYRGPVPLVYYRPGIWKRETISQSIEGVLHGISIADWDHNGREDILTASFLGVDVFSLGKTKTWERTSLIKGNPDAWPRSGSSEIVVGRLKGERFLSTIEPWHGNQVVVYQRQRQNWQRQVLDTSLNDGHVLLAADLNRDGTDELIAGFRGQGRSVYIYSAVDPKGARWARSVLDDGNMAAAGCAIADLNGDGKLDVTCIGTATTNLKWYENLGPAERK